MRSPRKWFISHRDLRRERLLRKWGKTYYFKQQSIGETFEFEFISVTPNDGQWHYIAQTVSVWVKKDKPSKSTSADTIIADVELYKDRTKIDHPSEMYLPLSCPKCREEKQ